MRGGRTILRIAGLSALALAAVLGQRVAAEEIAVGNYGVAANGMPFGVARAKGYFKQEGINVSGIITSAGGGTSLRNMLAGGVPYGEVNPGVVVAAIQQGADLKDRQRQRADRRRIRLGGEAGLADQDDQGLQGQEDRLHQSALDEPGARDAAAHQGGAQGGRRRAREDRRVRRRRRRARDRADRRRADHRAAVVASPRTSTARWRGRATCCRRSTTSSA